MVSPVRVNFAHISAVSLDNVPTVDIEIVDNQLEETGRRWGGGGKVRGTSSREYKLLRVN